MGIKQLFSCLLVIFLFSGCAVIAKNNDLFITQKINPSETLKIQLEELKDLTPAKQQAVVAVYPIVLKI